MLLVYEFCVVPSRTYQFNLQHLQGSVLRMLSISFFFWWQEDTLSWHFFQTDKAKDKCSDASSIAISLSNKDKNGISGKELITISEDTRYWQ